MLVLAGGFSYADALGAGRRAGARAERGLGDELQASSPRGSPVIGICNGFQALVRTGLLPGAGGRAALGATERHRRAVRVRLGAPRTGVARVASGPPVLEPSRSTARSPTARAASSATTTRSPRSPADDQIASATPARNPNGSVDDIAGISDNTGVVLGLMPHPENHVLPRQHPRHGRGERRPRPTCSGRRRPRFVHRTRLFRHAKAHSM